jgi:hypothetical protein
VVAHFLACSFYMWPVITSCENDALVSNAAFLSPSPTAAGWYWFDSCMQLSWRQHYELELLCDEDSNAFADTPETGLKLRICQETYELDHSFGSIHAWSVRSGVSSADLCSSWTGNGTCPYAPGSSFVAQPCKRCHSSDRLYVDALYWSLTTMTTIGYGDRSPRTQSELRFVIFAEVR